MKLKSLEIEAYRGIKKCHIKDLRNINIFLGDNNSGKTSILELIHFLKVPQDINYIKSVANGRSLLKLDYRAEFAYNDLISIFPRGKESKEIKIGYFFENNTHLHYSIMKDIFSFLFQLCNDLDIQVFITTHNNEVIDKFFVVFEDENSDFLKDMSIITLVKKNNCTVARTLSGVEANNQLGVLKKVL